MRTYERLNFNEWFEQFLTPHPQLQYFETEEHLYNLQKTLSKVYQDKKYTKEEIMSMYNTYLEKKREENFNYFQKEQEKEQELKGFKDLCDNKVIEFTNDLIKEI